MRAGGVVEFGELAFGLVEVLLEGVGVGVGGSSSARDRGLTDSTLGSVDVA